MENVNLKRTYRFIDQIEQVSIDDFAKPSSIVMLDGRGENIPPGVGYEVGTSIAYKLRELAQKSESDNPLYFLVSGDGRIDTPRIAHEIGEALAEQGITVLSAGYGNTTPMFEVNREKLSISGVNITASHQSYEHNGFKLIFDLPTNKNIGQIESVLNRAIQHQGRDIFDVQSVLAKDYIDSLINFAAGTKHTGRVLYDAMQGVSFPSFEAVARAINVEYDGFREHPNGLFPLTEKGPDPSHYANLSYLIQHIKGGSFSMVHIADGDGDRYALALMRNGEIRIVEPAHFVALRAAYLKSGPRTKFVAEYSLAAIVQDYLKQNGIDVVGVKRGRISHIRTTKGLGAIAIGAAEIGLHNYDENGFDDAVKNAFELMRIGESCDLGKEVEKIKSKLPFFFPELRVKSKLPQKILYDALQREYPTARDEDGIISRGDKVFWNLRASSNEDTKTLNISGDENAVRSTFDDLASILEKTDSDLANAFRKDLEKKLEDKKIV